MRRLHLANIILTCLLGTLLLWPNIKPSSVHKSIQNSYDSICMITTNGVSASGVLMESGFIITAAHVVDLNMNGMIDEEENQVQLYFPNINFETKATVTIISSYIDDGLDLAVLSPKITVPLKGSRLISMKDYRNLTFGTPLITIGMQMGQIPANVTDGRLISINPSQLIHRNSANSYFGNSGGGVFIDDELIGIAVMVGYDELYINVPIIERQQIVGFMQISYKVPLANSSLHISAPAIIDYLNNMNMSEVLNVSPKKCPFNAYFAVLIFNGLLVVWLALVFKVIRRWMN